jgi:hypothetical protein
MFNNFELTGKFIKTENYFISQINCVIIVQTVCFY